VKPCQKILQGRKKNTPLGLRSLRTTLVLNKVVGSKSEKGHKEKGRGDEERGEEREEPEEVREEEDEVGEVQRVRNNRETKVEEDGEEVTG